MSIRLYKSYTPGTRNRALLTFSEITKDKPEKSLIRKNHRKKGRNNRGVITIRHRGGGHKKRYRLIDFKRNKHNVEATVASIEYDPNRNALIALVYYEDGEKRYILHPNNLNVGDKIISGTDASLNIGNNLPLENIPLGTSIHNIELIPKRGGQIVRSAGTSAKILAKEGDYITLRLPSKEVRLIRKECFATIGEVSLRPELSSPARCRVRGGYRERDKRTEEQQQEILVSNLGCHHHLRQIHPDCAFSHQLQRHR